MAKKITRIDRAGAFETQFYYQDSTTGAGGYCSVPVEEADAMETTIQGKSWAQLEAQFNLDGETVIKTE